MACPALVYPQPAMYLPRSHLVGHSPFSHLSHPNSNPKSNPICNLILTLILTLTNPNLNSNPTLTLTLTLRRVTKVGRWTRAHLKPATSCHELKPYNDAISCPVFSANLKFRKRPIKYQTVTAKVTVLNVQYWKWTINVPVLGTLRLEWNITVNQKSYKSSV